MKKAQASGREGEAWWHVIWRILANFHRATILYEAEAMWVLFPGRHRRRGPVTSRLSGPNALPCCTHGHKLYCRVVLLYVLKLLGSSLSTFLVQPTQSICIQGGMSNTTSVIMAEATTLALATSVASLINLHNPNYLSGNQELVPFLNNTNFSSPSNWRIKVLT